MSEDVQQNSNGSATVSSFSGGTYDYLSQGKEQSNPDNGQPKVQEPWKPEQGEKKDGTPVWARKRFHEMTTTIKETKSENQRLREGFDALMKSYDPKDDEVKLEKFKKADGSPDYEAYTKAVLDAHGKELRTKWEQELTAKQESERQNAELNKVATDNYTKTKEELKDLDDALTSLDPGLEIDKKALEHLQRSPFGYKTLYRIGMDSELQDRLMQMDVVARTNEIAKIHDAILNWTASQEQNKGQNIKPSVAVPQQRPSKPIPQPPPKQRGSGDLGKPSLNMSGDDWIKARNKERPR